MFAPPLEARRRGRWMAAAVQLLLLLLGPSSTLAGCGGPSDGGTTADGGADASAGVGDLARPGSDRDGGVAVPDDGGGGVDADGGDGPAVPQIEAGALMSVQGVPPPQPGQPTPFFFVGCPAEGRVRVRLVSAAVDGVSDVGEWIGTLTRSGVSDHLVVGGSAGATRVDIQLDETGSIADAPFEYRTTVSTDPKLFDVTKFTFVTRMLNPSQPSYDEVGLGEPFHLVRCP